ncbi:MAG TPA: HAMP domain-containing histidine kinase [Sulfurovum sp.]|nr:HAMP domain-containing histidine kinase [Sulfurovum sp.]
MLKQKKELFLAAAIYFITIFILLMTVYRFLENWHLSEFNFFIAGVLVILVALGWGYVLVVLIFAPQKQMENTLTTLTHDIIHELNIPLSTIEANINMLKKTAQNEKSLKRLQRIEDASYRLKRLYGELVYTIKKEIHEIEKECFDVQKVVEERVAVFQEQERNPFVLVLEKYEIKADKIGFEQMLDNILSNAMKYSKKDTAISVTCKEHILCVEDKGIGMTMGELLRIHERYFQGDEKKEGTGIGLALVKTYCDNESMGIQIESEKDKGTRVYINLEKVQGICSEAQR